MLNTKLMRGKKSKRKMSREKVEAERTWLKRFHRQKKFEAAGELRTSTLVTRPLVAILPIKEMSWVL